ncbi:hypothetical protein HDU76_006533, partial [Blyttiomyces sp. JEL0837]
MATLTLPPPPIVPAVRRRSFVTSTPSFAMPTVIEENSNCDNNLVPTPQKRYLARRATTTGDNYHRSLHQQDLVDGLSPIPILANANIPSGDRFSVMEPAPLQLQQEHHTRHLTVPASHLARRRSLPQNFVCRVQGSSYHPEGQRNRFLGCQRPDDGVENLDDYVLKEGFIPLSKLNEMDSKKTGGK